MSSDWGCPSRVICQLKPTRLPQSWDDFMQAQCHSKSHFLPLPFSSLHCGLGGWCQISLANLHLSFFLFLTLCPMLGLQSSLPHLAFSPCLLCSAVAWKTQRDSLKHHCLFLTVLAHYPVLWVYKRDQRNFDSCAHYVVLCWFLTDRILFF